MESEKIDRSKLLHLLLDFGQKMLTCGGEINRVEDTLMRMGIAYGARQINVFVITSSIVLTASFPDDVEITQTRRIRTAGGTDFQKLEALNTLSRQCCQSPIEPELLQEQLEGLEKPVPGWMLYGGSMIAAFAFALFFGGTVLDGLAAAGFAIVICLLQCYLESFCPNKVVFNLIASLLTGIGICLLVRMVPGLHQDQIMIGDIMLLIPGIALTNSVRDVLVGETIAGAMRLLESLLWAGALAFGFIIAIWVMGG